MLEVLGVVLVGMGFRFRAVPEVMFSVARVKGSGQDLEEPSEVGSLLAVAPTLHKFAGLEPLPADALDQEDVDALCAVFIFLFLLALGLGIWDV